MTRIKVAYWTNGLGEEMSSRVHAEFTQGQTAYIVLHDWREGSRGHGFIVKPLVEVDLIREETPR
jgi:hypothetical protein